MRFRGGPGSPVQRYNAKLLERLANLIKPLLALGIDEVEVSGVLLLEKLREFDESSKKRNADDVEAGPCVKRQRL